MHRYVIGALAVALACGSAVAGPGDADEHLERGLAHYAEGSYDLAIEELRAGFEVEERPEFLFALAQAERLRGSCARALVYYRLFLDTDPPAVQVEATEMHIERCSEELLDEPEADAEDEPEPAARVAAVQQNQAGPRPRRWYHDVAGDVVLGTGTVATVVAIGYLASARGSASKARAADTYPDYDRHIDDAHRARNVGAVMFGAGAALVTGAVVRYVRGRDTRERTRVDVGPAAGGVGLSFGGRF